MWVMGPKLQMGITLDLGVGLRKILYHGRALNDLNVMVKENFNFSNFSEGGKFVIPYS